MVYLSMAANAGRHNNKALVSVTFTAFRSVGASGPERMREMRKENGQNRAQTTNGKNNKLTTK